MKKTNRLMLIILYLLFGISPAAFAIDDIIVDNTSADFSTIGTWTSSSYVPGYYGENYTYATGGSGDKTATWNFQLSSAGVYQVFAWWPGTYDTRSPDAPYTIYHMGGSTTVRTDQRINGAQWNDLGMYQCAAGQNRVMLTNAATNNPVADAVRIVYLGDLNYVVSQFTAAPLIGINPLSVSFTDTSLGAIQTWSWEFGDGEISAEQNPTHVYQNPGVYSVTLTVTGGGQQSTKIKTNYILVNPNTGTYATEFRWPVDEQDFFFFQSFGNERTNTPGYHAATDFGVYRFDVPAHCIANGWVEKINPDSYSDGMGYGIMIKHRLPDDTIVYSWYNHMAEPVTGFSIGQFIPIGTILGTVGETGWTPSGLHMHLEIKKNNDAYGGYVGDLSNHYNPYEFIYSRLSGAPSSVQQCGDGTAMKDCSAAKPLHCIEGGYLVENSILCGCAIGVVQADSTCTKTESGIIIDNNDPEFSYSGPWEQSNTVMGFYGSDYLIAYPWYGEATATWTPTIPASGEYAVYGWWREHFSASGSSRATNAPLTINHAGQQNVVHVDFSDYHKGWKYLGTFYFEAGSANSVFLSNIPNPGGNIIADAFRFVPVTTSTTSSTEPSTTTTEPDTTSSSSTSEPTTTTSIAEPTTTIPAPVCVEVTPASAEQGTTLDVTITGANTSFSSDLTNASFSCTGITVNSTAVYSPTQAVANITIAPEAPAGACDVTVTTGTEIITCTAAFTITAVQVTTTTTEPETTSSSSTSEPTTTIEPTTTVEPTTSSTTSEPTTTAPVTTTIPPRSIYGKVTGTVQADVTINLYQVSCGGASLIDTTITNADGYYIFSNLGNAGFYNVEALYSGCSFNPPSYINVSPQQNLPHDFSATCP